MGRRQFHYVGIDSEVVDLYVTVADGAALGATQTCGNIRGTDIVLERRTVTDSWEARLVALTNDSRAISDVIGNPQTTRTGKPPLVFPVLAQSEWSGRDILANLPAGTLDAGRAARCMVFANSEELKPAAEPMDDETGKVDSALDDGSSPGVSPMLALADELALLLPDNEIIVVPCCKGGSTSVDWLAATSRNSLYGAAVARVKKCLRLYGGTIPCCFCGQGYSNGGDGTLAARWDEDWIATMAAFATAVGAPNKWVYDRLPTTKPPASGITDPNYATLIASQAAIADADHVIAQRAGEVYLAADIHPDAVTSCAMGRRTANTARAAGFV